jgi:hypothetical protein
VHTGARAKAAARVKAPVRVHAQPHKLFIVLCYRHTEKDYISSHSYVILETKTTATDSKTLPHIEFPTLNFGEGPMSVFEAHFKEFFYTKDPNGRFFGKNVQYTDKIKCSDDKTEVHGVLRISLRNIPDESLPREMLNLLGQDGKTLRWMPSEQMGRIFSPSTWQRRVTGLKFSTQPESERIWEVLSGDPDLYLGKFWKTLVEEKC